MKWNNANAKKPPVNQNEKSDNETGTSIKVLVWLDFNKSKFPTNEQCFEIGTYGHRSSLWIVRGHYSDCITHWAIINKPKDNKNVIRR